MDKAGTALMGLGKAKGKNRCDTFVAIVNPRWYYCWPTECGAAEVSCSIDPQPDCTCCPLDNGKSQRRDMVEIRVVSTLQARGAFAKAEIWVISTFVLSSPVPFPAFNTEYGVSVRRV